MTEVVPAEVIPLHVPEEFSLRAVVHECMADMDAPDRDELLERVMAAITPPYREVALRQALPKLLNEITREGRREGRRPAPNAKSDRWGAVADQQGSGALAIYRWWITLHPDEPPKFFGDCTRDEVEQVASAYRRRALQMADQAQRFSAVVRAMDEVGAALVQEVTAGRLLEIFNA